MNRLILLFSISWILAIPVAAQQSAAADLVITNARVWTVDPARPEAESLAISGNRIVWVGKDSEILRWIGPKTTKVDAQRRTVLPGFNDSHVHFSIGGDSISGVQLRDAATPQEFSRRIGEHAKKLPKGEWLTGGTWDHELWGGTPLPSHDWIDALTPDTPVLVTRYDGHMALANRLVLQLAGITRETKD
jgi:predicted amidohydrolase YtcJ